MEGVLFKWTNYWSGWQPRWFVLDEGLLTYYKSQDEVNQGCKGSVQLSACEIIVHSSDTLRIDLVIPYEQHFYLKAPTIQERHAWLVAVGNAKAGVPPSIPKPKFERINSENKVLKSKKAELRLTCNLLMKQVCDVKNASNNPDGPDLQKLGDSTTLLSETCDNFIDTLEDCVRIIDDLRQESTQVAVAPITVLSKERKVSRSNTPSNLKEKK